MLRNLLPKIKTVILLEDKDKGERKRQEEWRYCSEAKKTSAYILNITDNSLRDEPRIEFHIADSHPSSEPNVRFIEPSLFPDIDAPLNKTNRGFQQVAVLDDTITKKKPGKIKSTHSIRPVEPISSSLAINMINLCPASLDLFVQRNRTIQHSIVPGESQCYKLISSGAQETACTVDSYDLDSSEGHETTSTFLFASVRHATVTISNRQEIKTFIFSPKLKIGLEVEMWGGLKLIISKIIEGYQAYNHKIALDGAEIIALNGKRVETFEQFRYQLEYVRRHCRDIVLQVAAYRGGKGKLDDFMLNRSKNASVRTLLSDVMMYGMDFDHQYDVDLSSQEASQVEEGNSQGDDETPADDDSPADKKATTVRKKKGSKKVKYFYDSEDDNDEASVASGKSRGSVISVGSDSLRMGAPRSAVGDSEGNEEDGALLAARNKPPKEEIGRTDVSLAQSSSVRSIEMENLSITQTEDVDWEFPTALDDRQDRLPFMTLVCVPDHLKKSTCWGQPTKFIQVSNFSSRWDLQLFWVDTDGALVPRAQVNRLQSTHIEQASRDHVWVIVANAVKDRRKGVDVNMQDSTMSSGMAESSIDDSVLNSSMLSSIMMIVRPSLSSLSAGKCMSVIWSPACSVSATQRMHPARSKTGVLDTPESHDGKEFVNPHMHIQVFDGQAKSTDSISNADDDDSSSVDFNSTAEMNNIFINPKVYKKSFKSLISSRRC